MKKRHEQKLVVLALALFLLFNIPFLLIFNIDKDLAGLPIMYLAIFLIWFLSIIISFVILKRHYE